MNYSTADYLNQLEQDREDLVDNLETKGITGLAGDETFTELVPEVLNIPSGGTSYFNTEPTTMSPMSGWMSDNFIDWTSFDNDIQNSTLTIPSNITSLNGLFGSWGRTVCPKVICGNNVTNMSAMYRYSTNNYSYAKLTQIDLSGLDTSNVTNFGSMFYNCKDLTSLDFSTFVSKSSGVVGGGDMFEGCTGLTTLDLSNFHFKPTSTNFDCALMFSGCTGLTSINFGNDFIDTTNYTGTNANISSMFRNCSSLTTLDLSSFKLPKLNSASNLFNGCTSLTHIDMRQFNFSNVSGYNNMFGTSASAGPPNNCEIIVADDTQKTWITTNFSRLTNVKTVAEYEAS